MCQEEANSVFLGKFSTKKTSPLFTPKISLICWLLSTLTHFSYKSMEPIDPDRCTYYLGQFSRVIAHIWTLSRICMWCWREVDVPYLMSTWWLKNRQTGKLQHIKMSAHSCLRYFSRSQNCDISIWTIYSSFDTSLVISWYYLHELWWVQHSSKQLIHFAAELLLKLFWLSPATIILTTMLNITHYSPAVCNAAVCIIII